MGRGHGGSRGGGIATTGYARNPELDTAYGIEKQERLLSESFLISPNIAYRPEAVGKKGYIGVTDPKVAAEINEAIHMYSKEIGLAEPTQFTIGNGKAGGRKYVGVSGFAGIELSSKYYGTSYEKGVRLTAERATKGHSVETSRPLMKTVHHELAHATYRYLPASKKAAVSALYSRFVSSGGSRGWGSYSKTSAEEFYAEGIAKSLTGKSDSYTKALRRLTW